MTQWTVACQVSLSFSISQSLLKLTSIESVMPSYHLVLSRPLLLLPPIPPSISALRIRWPKYWSFSFSISPSNEYSVLISFRIDWLELLAVQGTLKSLLQHHSSKAPVVPHSDFFMVQQLSRDYWKNHILTVLQQSDVSAFNTLWRFVVAFLPRSLLQGH